MSPKGFSDVAGAGAGRSPPPSPSPYLSHPFTQVRTCVCKGVGVGGIWMSYDRGGFWLLLLLLGRKFGVSIPISCRLISDEILQITIPISLVLPSHVPSRCGGKFLIKITSNNRPHDDANANSSAAAAVELALATLV